MRAEYFALLAAMSLGSATTFSGLALRTSTTLTTLVFSVIGTASVLWLITLFSQSLSTFATWEIAPYVVAGIFVPFVARSFFIEGIRRLGPARNSFLSSTQPLIATTLAVVFLGESPTLPTILGTCCIVGGVTLLSSRSKEQAKKMTWQPRDVFFPLFAGLLFASRDAVVRGAMFTLNNPYIAATTAATTSAIMLMTYLCVGRRWRDLVISRPNFLFLLFSGLCAGFFYFFLFNALSVGSVVVVSPLTGSAPVFVLFFSIAFVSDHEPITVRLILGGLIVMFGGSLITVF